MQDQVQIQNSVEDFRAQLRSFRNLTQEQGFHLPEEPEQACVQFASHPVALQSQICRNFAAYIETFLAAAKQKVKFHDGEDAVVCPATPGDEADIRALQFY